MNLLANLVCIIILLCSVLIIIPSSSVHAAYDDRKVDCSKNPPAGDEQGKVHQIASLCAYFSGKPHSKKPAVILLSDVWGYGVPKLRKFADKVASAGNFVVVPDLFFGDPTTNTTQKEVWLAKHRPEEAVKYVKPLIQVLKEKGIHKIGAAGFCWGGKVVVELAKEVDIIPVAALLHPSYTTVDDIKGVKVPMALLVGERDNGTPPEYVKESTAALKANQVDYFVKVYPGMPHGWTIRYKDDIPAQKKYSEEACQDLVDWFGQHLKKIHSAKRFV